MTGKKAGGRPSGYTPEILNRICEGISAGIPLAQICREDDMPGYSTVWDWMQRDEAVSGAIARARIEGEEVIASNTRNVARGLEGSTGDVQRDKLIIDTDLKLLAKWNPKKWGDRQQIDLDAKHSYEKLTEEQLDAEIKRHAAEAGVSLAVGGKGETEE